MNKIATIMAILSVFGVTALYCSVDTDSTNLLVFRVDPVAAAWTEWKKTNRYSTAEESKRYRIFRDNYNFITAYNNGYRSYNYKLGLNRFSDLTHQEWASLYTGVVVPKRHNASNVTNLFKHNITAVPNDSIDWRSQGRVRPIKNQGACGSSWAFAAVSVLEGLAKAKTGTLPNLSEQELIDCTRNMGNYGCRGGWSQNAFQYAANHGLAAQGSYPYTARNGACKPVTAAFKSRSYNNVSPRDVSALKQAIQEGPVVVYIEADRRSFQFYKSGVYNDPNCFAGGGINHAMTAVGYTDNAWIVRNSWGTAWGDQGYILISQDTTADENGICGILSNSNTFASA